MTTERQVKALGAFEIKDADKGEVEAIIATLGVVDRDGDVITPEAIADGAKVQVSSWGHDAVYGARPIGKGAVHVEGKHAIFRGRLFLQTTEGRETFAVLKELGPETEWSFGFMVQGSEVPDDDWRGKGAHRILTKLDAFEVSPVLIGAGKGTRTVALKEADDAARVAAEQEAAEQARVAAAACAAEAEAKAARLAQDTAAEYEQFQRTMRRFASL